MSDPIRDAEARGPGEWAVAAQQIRELSEMLTWMQPDDEARAQLESTLGSVLFELRNQAGPRPPLPNDHDSFVSPRSRAYSFASGASNPVALPLEYLIHSDGKVTATLHITRLYQGHAQLVHGGFVSVIHDQMSTAVASTVFRRPWFTRHLEVDFLAGIPLEAPIEVLAQPERLDGRKLWVNCSISAGDKLCSTARALMVEPRR